MPRPHPTSSVGLRSSGVGRAPRMSSHALGLPLSVACRYSGAAAKEDSRPRGESRPKSGSAGAGGLEGDEAIAVMWVVCGRALLVGGVVDAHFGGW